MPVKPVIRQPQRWAQLRPDSPFRIFWNAAARGKHPTQDTTLVDAIMDGGPLHANLACAADATNNIPFKGSPQGLSLNFPNDGNRYCYTALVPTSWTAGSNPFCLMAVMRFNAINGGGSYNVIASQRFAGTGWIFGSQGGAMIWYDNNNSINPFAFEGQTGKNLVVVLTGTSTTLTLYMNELTSSITLGGARPTPDAGFQLGCFSATNGPLNGTISAFAIGPTYLTPAQARAYIANPWRDVVSTDIFAVFGVSGAAQIAAINPVTLANISGVNGVTKANAARVNNLTTV